MNPVSVSKGTPATEMPGAGGAGTAKGKRLPQADDWTKDKKKEKENGDNKEKAKSVISKFVTDESSGSRGSPSPHAMRSTAK